MKTLLITLVLLFAGSSVVSAEQSSQSDVIVTVDSTNFRFSPSDVTVQEGQAVRFVWSGQALGHNAVANDGLFDSGEPERDVDYRFVFENGTVGVHTFVCEPHESMGMVGTVTVEAAPPVVVEEQETVETPALSLLSSLTLLAFVAVFRRPAGE
ncbi:MAG: plastocyanin/azurin family copper-binding protein [Candidatus Poseidoniaceae archaeon]|nr:plastocyanin/azurin family copper-binding protein [Candidatus Poseidoniaceae archaeon]